MKIKDLSVMGKVLINLISFFIGHLFVCDTVLFCDVSRIGSGIGRSTFEHKCVPAVFAFHDDTDDVALTVPLIHIFF